MNMYQTTSNYHYYNQHNLLISPSSASSIYSGQLINDDHFYANFDNANNSLIHMFINNNEQRLEQTMADQFYPNSSSSAFTFSSPSPSSSYNSSNGSGKMIMNWTPGSQDEPVVLCELDEITKSLNNQMVEVNEKKCKMIQNLDLSYNQSNASLPSVQTQIEQVDQLTLTSYDFNSNSIITRKLNETNLYNSIPHHPISEPLLIQQHQQQQQFNGVDLIQQSIQPSIDSGNCISNFTSLSTTNSPVSHPTINNAIPSTIKSSSLVSKSVLSSIQSNGLTGNLANSGLSSSSPIQTELNQLISSNNQLFANQATNQFQINQLNGSKTGQETTTNSTNQTMNNNHLLNAIIGYDSEGRPIRNTANKKERRRTLSINNAFSNLRDCIPNVPADTKLSKIKTLRLATSYISYLMELLDDSAPSNSKRRLMMTCEDFKVDLQRFKGRSKNSIHLIYPSKFTDKHYTRKLSTTLENVNSSPLNQSYLNHTRIQTFHQATNLNSTNNRLQNVANKTDEIKSNLCANQATTIHQVSYQVPTLDTVEQYDQTAKRIKGRTGWPQHVIKNVWASELQENSQNQ